MFNSAPNAFTSPLQLATHAHTHTHARTYTHVHARTHARVHTHTGVLSSMKSLSQTRRSLLSGWRAFALLRKSRSRSSLSSSKRRSWRQISRGRTAWTCSEVVQTGGGTLMREGFLRNTFRVPYRLYITAQKYRYLPCGVTARTKNIYLFWGCGIEKRGLLAYFGACQAKIPVRGWCKLNISRVRG